jgi:hypothetical protein
MNTNTMDIDEMCDIVCDCVLIQLQEAFKIQAIPQLYPGLEYQFPGEGIDPHIVWNIGKDNIAKWNFRFYVDQDIETAFVVTAIEFWYDRYDEISYKILERGENYDMLMQCFNILQYGIIVKTE